MIKLLQYILTLATAFVFLNCNQKSESKSGNTFYGAIQENKENREVKLRPEYFGDYYMFLNRIEAIFCADSSAVIQINEGNSQKHIYLGNICMQNIACLLIKRKNVLKIEDEMIHTDDVYILDSLESIMEKHYNNYGKNPFYSEKPERAIISISYDSIGINNLSKLLDKITIAFDKINPSTGLHILFEDRIPPPPNIE